MRCTVEEHNVIGGLGDAIAQVAAKNLPIPIEYIGTQDTFGESGTPAQLMEKYGLNAASNFLKICTFKYADGSTHQQTLKVKDEIFDDRYLRQALILMTIEKIRLLGEKAWQKIIGSETSLADLFLIN